MLLTYIITQFCYRLTHSLLLETLKLCFADSAFNSLSSKYIILWLNYRMTLTLVMAYSSDHTRCGLVCGPAIQLFVLCCK